MKWSVIQHVSWIHNWFQRDQTKVIVQSKWSNQNQFSCFCGLPYFVCVVPVGWCRQWLVFSGILVVVVVFVHRLWLAHFFASCSSALFFRPSELDNRDKPTEKKPLHMSFLINSLPLNNARFGMNIGGILWFCFFRRVFYAFHIRLVKNIIRFLLSFFSS